MAFRPRLAAMLLVAVACDASSDSRADVAADSLRDVGVADYMAEVASLEQACLTSDTAEAAEWRSQTLPAVGGAIRLPPRYEEVRGGERGTRKWVNPDSASLQLVSPEAADGSVTGVGLHGLREGLCALAIAGRPTRVAELRAERPGRIDSIFYAVAIAYPSDDRTIMATIEAPTRQARAELLTALSTLTLADTP